MPLTIAPDHLGLYIHVPFCARKCRYCDFASRPLAGDRQPVADYLRALEREAEQRRAEIARPLQSIYLGGGTPTMLTPRELARLWDEIVAPFPRLPDAEITLEANPGTLTAEHLRVIAGLPFTRVSLGAQSFDAGELRMLGRIHTPDDVEESVAALRAAGIAQINVDLMYGLPQQTAARWRATLERALALGTDHLSCYALMMEEDTPLTADIEAGILSLPGEEEEWEFATILHALLAEHGLAQYEVSNAARPGAESRHNLGYWLGRDYLGLGPAAASAIGGVRWRNAAGLEDYAGRLRDGQSAVEYVERLSAASRLLERVMLGLRLRDGFDLACAERECACALNELAGEIVVELIEAGLLERQGDVLRLTAEGYPLANQVVTRMMAAHSDVPMS
jgi:oxygen-independent coproporphyrinogen-3 oxidase